MVSERKTEDGVCIDCGSALALTKINSQLECLGSQSKESIEFQKLMSETLITIGQQQERIISIADKTSANAEEIDCLYDEQRKLEVRFNKHLITHGSFATEAKPDESVFKSKAIMFDRIWLWVIIFAAGVGGAVLISVMEWVMDTHLGGN